MTEAQAKEAITKAFTDRWPTVAPNVPFCVENEFAQLPQIPPGNQDQFAGLQIVMTTGQQLTCGGVGERFVGRNGWAQVTLWSPAGERTGRSDALAEAARSVFEMTDILGADLTDEPVNTMTSDTMSVGANGRWFVQLSRTQFTFYETK